MDVMISIVLCELEGSSIERKFSRCDPVCESSDRASEVRIFGAQIPCKIIEPQDDVGGLSAAVRHQDADDRRAIVGEGDSHSGVIGQRVGVNGASVRQDAEGADDRGCGVCGREIHENGSKGDQGGEKTVLHGAVMLAPCAHERQLEAGGAGAEFFGLRP